MAKSRFTGFDNSEFAKDTRLLSLEERAAYSEFVWFLNGKTENGGDFKWLDLSRMIGCTDVFQCKGIFIRLQDNGLIKIVQGSPEGSIIMALKMESYFQGLEQKIEKAVVKDTKMTARKIEIGKEMEKKAILFKTEVESRKALFPDHIIKQFIDYWLEPNKSNTKYRYEGQKFFDFTKRLATFVRNEKTFQGAGPKSGTMTKAKDF